MKVIAVDALLSIAKDVTLANGAKHRCIDATQIHELPKTEIIRCMECVYSKVAPDDNGYFYCESLGSPNGPHESHFYCADGKSRRECDELAAFLTDFIGE